MKSSLVVVRAEWRAEGERPKTDFFGAEKDLFQHKLFCFFEHNAHI